MNRAASALLALILIAGTPALATPCKDAKGKFVTCPPKPAPKPAQCKDAKGKFIKCPPAKPVPCKDANGKFASCTAPGSRPIR